MSIATVTTLLRNNGNNLIFPVQYITRYFRFLTW